VVFPSNTPPCIPSDDNHVRVPVLSITPPGVARKDKELSIQAYEKQMIIKALTISNTDRVVRLNNWG